MEFNKNKCIYENLSHIRRPPVSVSTVFCVKEISYSFSVQSDSSYKLDPLIQCGRGWPRHLKSLFFILLNNLLFNSFGSIIFRVSVTQKKKMIPRVARLLLATHIIFFMLLVYSMS